VGEQQFEALWFELRVETQTMWGSNNLKRCGLSCVILCKFDLVCANLIEFVLYVD
jgi:hypothetical protein